MQRRAQGRWLVREVRARERVRSTPSIPTGPKELEDTLPKSERKAPLGPLRNPDQAPWLRRPPTLEQICEANPKAPICFKPGGEPAVIPPVGSFNSLDVRFEHNLPTTPQGGTTAEGAESLAYVIERLQADPTLQVRLVGHASSEGTAQENLRLSVRRAKSVLGRARRERAGQPRHGPRRRAGACRLHARRVRHLCVRLESCRRRRGPPGGPEGRCHVPAQRAGALVGHWPQPR